MKPSIPPFLVAALVAALGPRAAPAQEVKHADPQKSCVSAKCHPDVKAGEFIHGPLAVGQCMVCHAPRPGPEHKFVLLEKGAELCLTCHEKIAPMKVMHKPVVEGKCLACHDPHKGVTSTLLRKSPVGELCRDCHKDLLKMKVLHGPVAKGNCTACHAPHGSRHENLVDRVGREACFSCHKEMRSILAEKPSTVHKPVLENCAKCHRTHDGAVKGLLAKDLPDFCFTCHESIQKMAQGGDFKHKALLEKNKCMECHDPHQSGLGKLLRKKEKELCFTCHDKLQAQITKAKYLHKPLAEGHCTGCHAVHGGPVERLLKAPLARSLYASYDPGQYALCFSCHEPKLAANAQTTTDTKFRNGDRNLHFLHVNKDIKGRTCAACHAVHAADQPHMVRSVMEFGKWKIPLTYTATATGGSCTTGCHREYAYDRLVPIPKPTETPAGP